MHLCLESIQHLFFLPIFQASKQSNHFKHLKAYSNSSRIRADWFQTSMQVWILLLFSIPSIQSLLSFFRSSLNSCMHDPEVAATRSSSSIHFLLPRAFSEFQNCREGMVWWFLEWEGVSRLKLQARSHPWCSWSCYRENRDGEDKKWGE